MQLSSLEPKPKQIVYASVTSCKNLEIFPFSIKIKKRNSGYIFGLFCIKIPKTTTFTQFSVFMLYLHVVNTWQVLQTFTNI